ncbi:MAG: hypothetical protein RSC44_04285, partial [Clostridia bacterium]
MALNEKTNTIKVAGKVNLTLNITGKRGNMHTLDMLMSTINLYDVVRFSKNNKNTVNLTSKSQLDGFDSKRFDAAMQVVADKFVAKFGSVGCDIEVEKVVPLGAGLGGSTASIIGVICALQAVAKAKNTALDDGFMLQSSAEVPNIHHGKQARNVAFDDEFLLSLGSDAPYMYRGGLARIEGVGENVTPLAFEKLWFVVVAPSSGVESRDAYKLYDELQSKNTALDCGFSAKNSLNDGCDCKGTDICASENAIKVGGSKIELRNDLTETALQLNDDVVLAMDALEKAGSKNTVMSGSGSSVISVCNSKSEAEHIFNNLHFNGFNGIY